MEWSPKYTVQSKSTRSEQCVHLCYYVCTEREEDIRLLPYTLGISRRTPDCQTVVNRVAAQRVGNKSFHCTIYIPNHVNCIIYSKNE